MDTFVGNMRFVVSPNDTFRALVCALSDGEIWLFTLSSVLTYLKCCPILVKMYYK